MLNKIKKAAMFGLEFRALKKQFSKSFLVRMQSVDSKETHGASIKRCNSFKLAAMFGLDARIALAIFGTVSAMSFAVMHSVIKDSQASKYVFEFKEIGKAVDAFEQDTDSTLPIIATGIFNITDLKVSAKPGWKTRYVDYEQVTGVDSNKYLVHKSLGKFSIFQANDRSAVDITDSPYNSCADANKTCYLWLLFDGGIRSDKISAIDSKVDSDDGFLTGRVQKFNSDGMLFRVSVREYYP